ncbi:beta-ketoacyl-[acyl-carrier-protein] synthase family protein [Actinomadura sp. KC216]|uniref:beta-ketoacyl-[acyl-carrier-protein] synthase family protein n=1 Tax=Actinomadura sp. KC216 TaxID=2530370 RepID=UPI0010E3D8C6|nr:beta-ketoacyl-[acyl-carrier-protein] synthase family protein [Actinomadura sp. KC216]TDB91177.1 beta-ketoacyl-[acyl-carrier-protein] synthase family protein [Actinomadura sp. KC216]
MARDHVGRWRVAITGMGVKSPAGCDLKSFTEAVRSARPTAALVTGFDTTGLPSRIGCQIQDFDPNTYASAKMRRRMSRFAQMGLAAALDAYVDAGSPSIDPLRAGISSGSCFGGTQVCHETSLVISQRGPQFVSPFTASMHMANSPAAYIGPELGWHGPSVTTTTACATGTDAINAGTRMIREGEADAVLAGAVDTDGVGILMLAAFGQTGALSSRNDDPGQASRPFDADRDGYVMGEGAAYLMLERYELAAARGARIYGEIAGCGRTSDSHHITAPHPEGRWVVECMRAAIRDADLTPAAITQVNCHATATPVGDAAEARALLTVFNGAPPPVTASKGVFGHAVGAAGAVEAIVAVLSARDGLVPPTGGFDRLSDDCAGLDVVAGAPRRVDSGPVVSNSFGVGGQNASVVIVPPEMP